MKRTIVFVLAALAFASLPQSVRAAPLVVGAGATVRAALEAIDASDRASFVAAFATDAAILDEISPFRFGGSDAAGAWFDRLAAVNRANVITGERSSIVGVPRGSVEGDDAYVVVDVRIDYRERGRAIVENGAWTFALKNADGRWKIDLAAFAPQPTVPRPTR